MIQNFCHKKNYALFLVFMNKVFISEICLAAQIGRNLCGSCNQIWLLQDYSDVATTNVVLLTNEAISYQNV